MSADKLAEALRAALQTAEFESHAKRPWHTDAKKALAAHEADRALAALTAEQKRLGMYGDEKQEPDRLDAERYRELRPGRHWSVIDWIGNDLRGDVLDVAIDKAIAAKEAKP